MVLAARDAGASTVLHSCGADLPVALVAGTGVRAVSFDLSTWRDGDEWGAAWESGVDLWPGVVPAVEPADAASTTALTQSVLRWLDRVGADGADLDGRLVITPTCGLAGASTTWARKALAAARDVAAHVDEELGD